MVKKLTQFARGRAGQTKGFNLKLIAVSIEVITFELLPLQEIGIKTSEGLPRAINSLLKT